MDVDLYVSDIIRMIEHLPPRAKSKDVKDALSIISYAFRKNEKGAYENKYIAQRSRRIKLERLTSQIKSFYQKSERLFWADSRLSATSNPRFASMSPSQLIAADDKIRAITRPGLVRGTRMREEFGVEGARQVLLAEKNARDRDRFVNQTRAFTEFNKTEYSRLFDTYGSNAGLVLSSQIDDEIERIRNPGAYKRRMLVNKFGSQGANRILSEERDEIRERGIRTGKKHRADREFTHWYDTQSDYNKERFDLIQHYGGGSQGIAYAEEELSRRSSRRMREAESRGSVRQHRERLMLMKEFPVFFANSRRSTKELKNIAKIIRPIGKIPILGSAVRNPIGFGAGLATAWIAKAIHYITSTAVMGARARRAGLSASEYRSAEIELKPLGGSGESYSRVVGGYSSKMGRLKRGLTDSSFLNDYAAFGVNILGSGFGGLATSREMTANVANRIKQLYDSGDEEQAIALADLHGFDQSMYQTAIEKGSGIIGHLNQNKNITGQTRGSKIQDAGRMFDRRLELLKETFFMGLQAAGYLPVENSEKAKEAAESLRREQSSSGSSKGSSPSEISGKQVSAAFYIQNIEMNNVSDVAGFVDGMIKEGGERFNDIDIMTWADGRNGRIKA